MPGVADLAGRPQGEVFVVQDPGVHDVADVETAKDWRRCVYVFSLPILIVLAI